MGTGGSGRRPELSDATTPSRSNREHLEEKIQWI